VQVFKTNIFIPPLLPRSKLNIRNKASVVCVVCVLCVCCVCLCVWCVWRVQCVITHM